jgi:NADH:ubiquinone oxidoreductase subunit E
MLQNSRVAVRTVIIDNNILLNLRSYTEKLGNKYSSEFVKAEKLTIYNLTNNQFQMSPIQLLIKDLAEKHGRRRDSLLPIMQGVVTQERFLSEYSMVEIARELDIPASEVYGTATFYSFLEAKKMGKNIIRVCRTITCSMKGKGQILFAIQDMLKIKIGETTPDGRFTLLETNCLGWCHKAPAMLINDDVYTDLTPEKVRETLSMYMKEIHN